MMINICTKFVLCLSMQRKKLFHAIWSRRLEKFHLAIHCNQCLLHIGISGGRVEACPIKLFLLFSLGAPAHFNGRNRQTLKKEKKFELFLP